MPQLANKRFDQFCLAKAGGKTNAEAARFAGYSGPQIHNTACRLLKNPKIIARIKELMTPVEGQHAADVTRPWTMTEMVATYRRAAVAGDNNAALKALELICKVCGYLVERKESVTAKFDINALTPAQLNQLLRGEYKSMTAEEQAKYLAENPEAAEVIEVETVDDTSTPENEPEYPLLEAARDNNEKGW